MARTGGRAVERVDEPQEKALTTREVRDELETIRPQLEQLLPRAMDPERFLRLTAGALLKSPTILQCDRISIFRAVLEAAQLGLEPTGLLGSAYIVPYRVHGRLQAQLIPGYRGLIDLARRSGEVETIYANVVRGRDYFRLRQGTDPGIDHEPFIAPAGADEEDAYPGPVVGAYMVAVLRDRSGQASIRQIEWMSYAEIEAVRRRSKAADGGPWVTDWTEMARKTVVRRGAKYLPLTAEAVRGFSLDEIAERDAEGANVSRETSRSRLVSTLAARKGLTDGSGAPEEAEVESDVAPSGNGAPRSSGEVCGSLSDPALGEIEECILPAGHEGPHQSRMESRWPRAVPEARATPEEKGPGRPGHS